MGRSLRIQLSEMDATLCIFCGKGFFKKARSAYKIAAGTVREGSRLDVWDDSPEHTVELAHQRESEAEAALVDFKDTLL